jgi:lysophospholipase L1-like esterase
VAVVLLLGGGLAVRRRNNLAGDRRACADVSSLEQRLRPARLEAASGSGPLLAVLGDSIAQGLRSPRPMETFPYLMGAGRVVVDAVGGSGYVNSGPCGGARYSQRLSRVLADKPSALVVQGGTNDKKAKRFEAAVRTLFAEIRRTGPTRTVIVGPYPPGPSDRRWATRIDRTLQQESQRFGFRYVSLLTLHVPLLPDGKHPTHAGQRVIAGAVAVALH